MEMEHGVANTYDGWWQTLVRHSFCMYFTLFLHVFHAFKHAFEPARMRQSHVLHHDMIL